MDLYSAVGSSTGLAEMEVLGSCAVTPSVRVAAPLSEYLQTSTTSLTATAQTCLDPVNNAGWGVRFLLDGGPSSGGVQMDTHTPPYQVTFTNLAQSEHTIDAYLLDSSNNVVSGIDTHDQVNHIGIGDYFVALGDSISEGHRGRHHQMIPRAMVATAPFWTSSIARVVVAAMSLFSTICAPARRAVLRP